MRKWRNWQTRTFEGRVVHTVRVQVPSSAPTIKGWILSIPLLFVQKYHVEPAPIPKDWIALRNKNFETNKPQRKAWFVSPSSAPKNTAEKDTFSAVFFYPSRRLGMASTRPRVVWNCDEVAHGIARSAYQSSFPCGLIPHITS